MSINVGTAVAYLDLDASKFTAGLKAAQQSLQGVSKDTNTFSTKITSLGSGLKQTGATLSLVSVPLLGLGALAVKTASNFEAGMSEVKAITGATGKDFEALEKQAKELGSTTKFSASQAAEGMKYFGMAGYDTEKILAAMPNTLNLAAAAGTDLGTTCDIVSDAMSGLKMSAEETGRFTDIMAATVTGANTSVELMGETLKYVGPIAGTLGINMEDLSLAIGIMGNNGIKGSQAGTALKTGLTNLISPTSTMKKAMDEYNISIVENADGTVNLRKTMENLREKMSGLDETQQAAALSAIFGKEALSGWASIVNASEEDFYKLAESIDNSNGKAGEMADVMQDNLQGALTNLGSAFEGVLITIGEALIPIIETIVQKLNDWCTWFNTLDGTTQTVIIAIGGFIAILGPLLLIIGQLIISVTAIVGVFTSGGVAATAFGAVMGALSGPIGIVIGVIAALITIGVLLYKNWEEICAFGTQVWNAFTQWFSATMESVTNFFKQVWESCCQAVSNIWESIKTTAANVFNGIKDTITNITNGTKAVIQSIWETIKNYFSSVLNNIKNIVSTLFNNVRNIINSIMQGISNQIQNIWNAIKTIFSNVLGLIKGIVSTDFALIKSSITNILNAVKDFCSSTWSNILSTCSSILGGIVNTVANIFNGIKNSIANGLQAAYNTALGWWENIKSIFSAPINAVVNIFKKESTQTQSLDDGIAVASDMPTNENLSRAKFDFESTRNALDTSYITQSLMQSGLNALETKLNVKQSNQPVNNNQTINLNLNIDKVENSNERNIEDLADELAFYLKRKRVAF